MKKAPAYTTGAERKGMCFRSKKYYEREIKRLKEKLTVCDSVIKAQTNREFKKDVEIRDLREKLNMVSRDRDDWKDIAHQVDAARRTMLRKQEGKWEKMGECEYRCLNCGKIIFADDENERNYCPCCGAKMLGVSE